MYKNYVLQMEDTPTRGDGSEVEIGDRLVCDEYRATLKYIGLVPPTKGVWYGVEWDDIERGKHDGTHEGHTYFKTKHPKSGSFIRPKKANFGISFMSAVNDRYGRTEDENAGVITEDLYVVDAYNKTTVVEMVGARKVNELQSKLNELKEVVVRGLMVYGTLSPTDQSHDLASLVPSIENLDISLNLIKSWKQIAEITEQLKNLRVLNVSENILDVPEKSTDLQSSLSHIDVLLLNRSSYNWSEILHCCDMFTNLEQIHLCFNNINVISDINGRFQHLNLLNLESNNLSDWSYVLHFGHLPLLETLIVSNNQFTKIEFPSNGSTSTDLFQKLKSLTINYNKIADWQSINELNKLQALEVLRTKSNPLMDLATPETVRQLLIAKIKHLKVCNRTPVNPEERKGSEIDYLKRFGSEWLKCGGSQDSNKNKPSNEFVSNHPRYNDLIQIWGPPEDSEMLQKMTSLKSSLINVKIFVPSMPDKKTLEKKVPGSMTVQKLKALIYRLYKLDTEIQLSYISQKVR
ncbi:hypothetical protein ACF0H5_003818 [Mactra antiquata]